MAFFLFFYYVSDKHPRTFKNEEIKLSLQISLYKKNFKETKALRISIKSSLCTDSPSPQ